MASVNIAMTNFAMLKDIRSRAQKIGDPEDEDDAPLKQVRPRGATLTAMEKAERVYKSNARHIFVENAETLAQSLIDIAMDPSQRIKDRLEAHRMALQFALGRPSTVHVNEDGKPATPIFNIKIGSDAQPITAKLEFPTVDAIDTAFDQLDDLDNPDD